MEKTQPRVIKLSRFFDKNVYLVAGVCAKCYAEDADVKITAINRKFLKQVEQRKELSAQIAAELSVSEHTEEKCLNEHSFVQKASRYLKDDRTTQINSKLSDSENTSFQGQLYNKINAEAVNRSDHNINILSEDANGLKNVTETLGEKTHSDNNDGLDVNSERRNSGNLNRKEQLPDEIPKNIEKIEDLTCEITCTEGSFDKSNEEMYSDNWDFFNKTNESVDETIIDLKGSKCLKDSLSEVTDFTENIDENTRKYDSIPLNDEPFRQSFMEKLSHTNISNRFFDKIVSDFILEKAECSEELDTTQIDEKYSEESTEKHRFITKRSSKYFSKQAGNSKNGILSNKEKEEGSVLNRESKYLLRSRKHEANNNEKKIKSQKQKKSKLKALSSNPKQKSKSKSYTELNKDTIETTTDADKKSKYFIKSDEMVFKSVSQNKPNLKLLSSDRSYQIDPGIVKIDTDTQKEIKTDNEHFIDVKDSKTLLVKSEDIVDNENTLKLFTVKEEKTDLYETEQKQISDDIKCTPTIRTYDPLKMSEIEDPSICPLCLSTTFSFSQSSSSSCSQSDYYCTPPGSQKPFWSPPKSPHNLIEESLYHNPWALLVATIFLNKTSCMMARPSVEEFLKDNPSPEVVLSKSSTELEKYFTFLGLHKKRSEQVWRMSHDFLHKKWKNVKELYGIGQYGEDAYRMFCLGDMDVKPRDRFLKIYLAWYNMMAGQSRTASECQRDCECDELSNGSSEFR